MECGLFPKSLGYNWFDINIINYTFGAADLLIYFNLYHSFISDLIYHIKTSICVSLK